MTPIFIISSIVFILLMILGHAQRGGSFFNFRDKLKAKGIWMPRNLLIVGLIEMPIFLTIFLILNGFSVGLTGAFAGAIGLGYTLAWMQGWGSYFDMGSWLLGFKGHREVLWIDWILNKVYGPIWIPKEYWGKIDETFDLINSPDKNGEMRPYKWRFKRDRMGMNLRGSYGILITGAIAAVKYFMLAATIPTVIMTTMCFLPLLGMGYVYAHFGKKADYEKYSSRIKFHVKKQGMTLEQAKEEVGYPPTAKAEFAMGLPIALSIITAIFI